MMLPWTLSVGAALSALLAAASAECDREALFKFADSYVFAQENGHAGYLENIADNFTYVENNKTHEITTGILNNALVIDHRHTIADTIECATFTELVVTRNASGMPAPYVIGTQIRHSPGDMSCYLIDSIVTTEGHWLFNATGTLYWVQRENWGPIPEAERDSRDTLKAAADAYLSMWDNKSAIDAVPWGTPCARLEGGVYTGNGGPNDSCKVGIPTNNTQAPNSYRRYVIDETVGAISVLCIFEHLENAPDSHEFRLEKGKPSRDPHMAPAVGKIPRCTEAGIVAVITSTFEKPRSSVQLCLSPTSDLLATEADDKTDRDRETPTDASSAPEPGPMARRLEEATEEALLTGGRAGRRAVEEAGFSEELKERLFARVKDAQFRSENAAAFAEAGMPTSAGQATRLMATSQPWTGTETTQDAVLRMLNDAHKPLKPELRGRPKMPDLQPVDMRMGQEPRLNAGRRAASARDKASAYSGMGLKELEKGLSEDEKEAMKKEFRDRFRPAARAMPNTLTGLASLANERIEDAIARGQFKNIPRGRGVERDSRADNPFIDTTEYIMNKMIKRQDIVPPWIEKQQELVRQAHVFRTRLRNDWKRYAARMIASKGGSLEEQMNRARRYAKAEELHNPRKRDVDQIAVPTNSTDDPVMAKMRQQGTPASADAPSPRVDQGEIIPEDEPLPPPFRDSAWIAAEKSYMDLSIGNLNALTRSYNLMAPELAKKPYFSLERELNSCFADVAPQLADVIKERAAKPSPKSVLEALDGRQGSVFDRFGGRKAKVYESKAPHYGFREMWRDLFTRQPS
ncbi:hypothetical protein DL767_007475 [Monosporascus sp. MG133]|nr:hypothetical protein DL767_007475 [Monosporascus sp. MG133]